MAFSFYAVLQTTFICFKINPVQTHPKMTINIVAFEILFESFYVTQSVEVYLVIRISGLALMCLMNITNGTP